MQFGHPEEYLTRLPRRGARDCIAIEIAFSIETIVTIELIMVSITVITLELGIVSIFADEAVHTIEMSISCRGCWGIRSAQWQGELDGPDVTGRDVSWEMTENRVRHRMDPGGHAFSQICGHLHLHMPWDVRMLVEVALEI
jgi:hypothetical protein